MCLKNMFSSFKLNNSFLMSHMPGENERGGYDDDNGDDEESSM
jgi:hypothetical protein